MLKKIFPIEKSVKQKEEVLINILTRTSSRPIGFYNCRQSIEKQSHKKIKHYVSYENDDDIAYIDYTGVSKIKVRKYKGESLVKSDGSLHAPYNLYCNELLDNVEDGWIMFLDDDDDLFHNKVIQEIVCEIQKADENTLFIWQMRYPNGKLLPTKEQFKSEQVEMDSIGSPCFIFHSRYKGFAKWDHWKASDYRVIKKLHETIPRTKWIEKVYIQINNYGDYGNRNDIVPRVTRNILFDKTWFWFLIPKYHTQINSIYIFQEKTYRQYWNRAMAKMKKFFQ